MDQKISTEIKSIKYMTNLEFQVLILLGIIKMANKTRQINNKNIQWFNVNYSG